MNRARGETGVLVAGIGGVLLLVSLFLDWYSFPTFTLTAWSAFEVWDLVLAALALAVIVSAATEMGWWRGPTHRLGVVGLGVAAVVIVASQLIEPPPSALHAGIGEGGWLGLVGAGLMVVGALAESGVRLSIDRAGPPAGPGGGPPRTRSWRRPAAADAPVSAPLAGPVDVPRRRPGGPVVRPPDAAAHDDPDVRPQPPRV